MAAKKTGKKPKPKARSESAKRLIKARSFRTSLILRTVDGNRRAYGGFEWPASGPVECPDWDPSPRCGGGLHGWLRGEGDAGASGTDITDPTRLWQVVEVREAEIVDLGGKVKFPRGSVLYTGTREEAVRRIQEAYPGAAVIYGTATAGYFGTATAGNYGTATAGDSGTATAGNYGTATAGDGGTAMAGYNGTAMAGYNGTAMAGYNGTATAGERGTATAGDSGHATAGYKGTATAGYNGTATAGDSGHATAGDSGTATAGNYGTATAGDGGTAMAGERGIIALSYWDDVAGRRRTATGYIGEDDLKPGVRYRLNSDRKFEVVK